MNRARILLKLVLEEAGLHSPELTTFGDRLRLQKLIYIVQMGGLDLGYRYNWYLRGPYCPGLTRDAFLLREEIAAGENAYGDYELSKEAQEMLCAAKAIWSPDDGSGSPSNEWLELLASLHYLKNVAYWPGNNVTKERVFEKLMEAKPHFANQHQLMEAAWRRLQEWGLAST
jgi:uncharacterized protein YwgA